MCLQAHPVLYVFSNIFGLTTLPCTSCAHACGAVSDEVALADGVSCVKVLSTGRLRATVSMVLAQDQLVISCSTTLPDNFLVGANLIASTTGIQVGEILQHDIRSGKCQLRRAMDHQLCSGELLELDFGMEAPVLAARLITQTPPERPLPRAAFHLATTKSTNALLERKGDPTAFVVTKGFKDLLKIGDQRRPDLFALNIDQADPLHDLVFEFDERMDAHGDVLKPFLLSFFQSVRF